MKKRMERVIAMKSWEETNREMYLIEGTKKAFLLDTGIGIGNVKEIVEKITNKPIEVCLTHGHGDHGLE